MGKRHCALCEITHGLVRTKPDWIEARESLPVEFTAVHLDERDPAVAEASRGQEPCVVAVRDDGSTEVVIGRSELEDCEGDPLAFAALLRTVSGLAGVGSGVRDPDPVADASGGGQQAHPAGLAGLDDQAAPDGELHLHPRGPGPA